MQAPFGYRSFFASEGPSGGQSTARARASAPGAVAPTTSPRPSILGPVGQLSVYLVGVHTLKADPRQQFVAHHYCHKLDNGLIQCAIFDSSSPTAHLIGIEYIVSGEVYRSLPANQQQYWHPHTYEIDGHLLRAPEMSPSEEQTLLADLRSTYGRTYHEWDPHQNPICPMGTPDLAWAITGPGQIRPDIRQEFSQGIHR